MRFLAVLVRVIRAQTINRELNDNAVPAQIIERAKQIRREKCIERLWRQ